MLPGNNSDVIRDVIHSDNITNATLFPMLDTNSTDINASISVGDEDTVEARLAQVLTPAGISSFVLTVLGLAANVCSILATLHIPQRKKMYYKLMINLAISDALINLAVLLYDLLHIYDTSDCLLELRRAILVTALIGTLLNLLAMALHQNVTVFLSLLYDKIVTSQRANICIALIWIISIFCGLSDAIVASWSDNLEQAGDFCSSIRLDSFDVEILLIIITFIVLCFIVGLYLRIHCVAVRTKALRDDKISRRESSRNLKATLLILVTFIVCWLPLGLSQIIIYLLQNYKHDYQPDTVKLLSMLEWLFVLYQVNTVCDPLIYAARLKEVQMGYKYLYSKLLCRARYSINEEAFRKQHGHHQARRATEHTLINVNTNSTDDVLMDGNEISINEAQENMDQAVQSDIEILKLSPMSDEQEWPKSYGFG